MTLHNRWTAERKNEFYYKLAKKLDYRSRAAFKLMQIDDRFGIFREKDSVVDLGASPGGWLQVAKQRVGPKGVVIGVDLRHIKPLEGVKTIMGDITENKTILKILEELEGKSDVVISDMAPNIGGHYDIDHARSVDLCLYAVDVCDHVLKSNGKLVVKVFMGDMMDSLLKELKKRFRSVRIHSPAATRQASSEVYIISKGYLVNYKAKPKIIKEEEWKPEFEKKGINL